MQSLLFKVYFFLTPISKIRNEKIFFTVIWTDFEEQSIEVSEAEEEKMRISHINRSLHLLKTLRSMDQGGGEGGPGPSQFLQQQKQVRFYQTHNQGLCQLLLKVSWDLHA